MSDEADAQDYSKFERKPDYEGIGGKAWDTLKSHENGKIHTTVASYLLESKQWHPFWNQWMIVCVSLKDVEGMAPAHKNTPEMTHEIMIISVNPDVKISPDKAPEGSWMLEPLDLVKQFTATDEEAAEIVRYMIMHITNGKASPDSDFRSYWERTIDNTVDHLNGKHEKCKH